ncbi:MAG TPA: 4Fe-4S dicluster domain-containing protein, partial [Chthoniobacteraceae bacterium]
MLAHAPSPGGTQGNGVAPPVVTTIIDDLLAEQQQLTAVERFSRRHSADVLPAHAKFYRDLIPIRKPESGEQYAFAVDLDACTGCKACVSACHSLNGLEEDEIWRNVGSLHGGTADEPYLQTVTTACHHCIEPACLEGCPVLAYEKDEDTGIVRHLDDQCIGCQYCVLKCPYDVPKYSATRGIVRKCDMCHSRLAADEAPACVQACPTHAISIRIVNKSGVIASATGSAKLL